MSSLFFIYLHQFLFYRSRPVDMPSWATSAVCVRSILTICIVILQVDIFLPCSADLSQLTRFLSMLFISCFTVYPEKRKRKDESLLSQSLASRSDTHFLSPLHGHHHGASAGASNSMNVSGSGVSGVSFSGLSNVSTSPGTNAVTASGAATAATSPTAAGVVLHTGNNNNNNHTNNGTNHTVSTQPISPPSAHTRVSTKAHFNSAIHTMSHEISTMASLAFHKSSKSSSSASNSMWLEEEYDQNVLQTLPERAESSSNWSSDGSSSSSSLFFNRGQRGGVVMQNTFDIVGNYFYASPEMAGGTCILNQAVDWWAVGVLLFHLLSGEFFFLLTIVPAIFIFTCARCV